MAVRHPTVMVLSAVVAMFAVTACVGGSSSGSQGQDEVTRTKEQARTDAKQRAEELADRVGTNPQTNDDGTYNPGGTDDIMNYRYSIKVKIDDDAFDRVRGPIADDMREQGWDVRDEPDDISRQQGMLRLLKPDGRTAGVTVTGDKGYANVNANTKFTK